MEPVFFVMAILGCGEAGDTCRPVRTLPVHYATAEACSAASGAALAANTDLDYPEIAADCRPGQTRQAAAANGTAIAMRP